MSATWTFVLTDSGGNALAELSTASGRSISFKRNSYSEVTLTLSHEDDAASLLLASLNNTGIPRLKGYRRGPNDSSGALRFRGPLMGLQETSEETSLLTATFRSPFAVLVGDGDKTGRFLPAGAAFTAADAGQIAMSLVDAANRDSPTGLATDPALIVATKARDRQYPNAQNIGAAVTDLTAVLDGFDFFESFVESGSTTRTPAVGVPTSLSWGIDFGASWTGGSGTFYWVVTAVVGGVETGPSNEVAIPISGSPPAIDFSWTAVSGASNYKIYRSTISGGQTSSPALVATVGSGTLTYQETGTATTAGAVSGSLVTPLWNAEAYLNVVASLGQVRSTARFEYGAQTLSNVLHMERTTTPPQNSMFITGGNGLTSTYVDATSVAKYGKWWGQSDFSSIIEQTTLDDKAKALVRPNPVKTVTFIPELGLDNCPKPFDDWTLGDTVSLYASRSALVENTQLRINGFTVPIDDNGNETVSVNDPTSPEEDAITMASLTAEVLVADGGTIPG